jgi:non-specific serine/threonine protein kinase
VALANLLIERQRSSGFYFYRFPLTDYLEIIASTHSPLFFGDENSPLSKGLQILDQAGELSIELSQDTQGLHLNARLEVEGNPFSLKQGEVQVISQSPFWVLVDRYLIRMAESARPDLVAGWLRTPEVLIPPRDEAEFLEKFYLPLARQLRLNGENVRREQVQAAPLRRLYLSDAKGELKAALRFGYGDFEVPYDPALPAESLMQKTDAWTLVEVQRQPEFEQAAFNALTGSAYGLKRGPLTLNEGVFVLRRRVDPVEFLLHYVPRLAKDGFEVYGEEKLRTARVNRSTPRLSFSVSSGIDWFDVQMAITFGDNEVSLKEIRRILRKKERYVKLADGSIGVIPEEWLERYRHLFGLGKETADGVRFSQHHLVLLNDLLAGADRSQTDPLFERRRERLRQLAGQGFAGIPHMELPAGFTGELRPYQKAGYEWLHFLREIEFGGCLADDMGLGKTVQALVFFQSLREGVDGMVPVAQASLLVVPRSLLVNWQREAVRFTPGLRILVYFDKDRIKDTTTFDQYDLVLTTYGVMLRDVQVLQKYTFNYVLLDESQTIKNPLALTARAARLLKASHRLVLTGTPVENSSLELWSQFAFLNPGLLGNLDYFKEEFATPIEKKGDEQAAQFLRRLVYPFILRRTKDQVAPELPPRSERILYSDMDPAQRKLYNRMREYYRGMLMGMIETGGMNTARLKILEGLLRLRQICNHPRLVDDKFRGESGKFELLLETLDTLRSEGHKALVYSQFVQMLRLVREALDAHGVPYTYLDGRTRDRQGEVDTFQGSPDIPFFLISLKAGGVGLNLTAADYVIHIDPWWNPAVELQASDRTHRIGQDKPVFVYKLITRDSVEEKIVQLQERKKSLVDQLITTEGSFFKEITAEDVKALFS